MMITEMDLEKLEKIAKLLLEEMPCYEQHYYVTTLPTLESKFKNLLELARKTLPEHEKLFAITHAQIKDDFRVSDANDVIGHLLKIIEIEKTSEILMKELKIFESAEEKIKQAGLSFRKKEYTSVFHNLNTALELVLKDKVGIPLTITQVNISKIIDILVKHKVKLHPFLTEAKKRVTKIDDKIKHRGYSPSKRDCIFAIKVTEKMIAKLRNTKLDLTEAVRNKIYKGL